MRGGGAHAARPLSGRSESGAHTAQASSSFGDVRSFAARSAAKGSVEFSGGDAQTRMRGHHQQVSYGEATSFRPATMDTSRSAVPGSFVAAGSRGKKGGPSQEFQTYSRAHYGQNMNFSRTRRKRRLWSVVLVLSVLVLLVCLVVLGMIAWSYYSGTRLYDEVARSANVATEANALAEITVDWDALFAQNPDTVAWIYMPGTPIDYPVVQGEDDEEYLYTDFTGNYQGLASLGAIFLSAVNSDDFSDACNYLYGHRLNNGTMFGSLVKLQDQDVFDETRTLYILTPTCNYRCSTIALDIVANTETSIIQPNFLDSATMANYLQERIDAASAKADDIDLASISKVFALITCGNSSATTRAVLFAGVMESAVPVNAETSADDSNDASADDADDVSADDSEDQASQSDEVVEDEDA